MILPIIIVGKKEVLEMNEAALLFIVGIIIVPILQLLKKSFGFSGGVMLWFSALAAFAAAALTTVLTGETTLTELFSDPMIWLGSTGIVYMPAMLMYGSIKEKMGLSGDQPIIGG